jgi:hypothetical protein
MDVDSGKVQNDADKHNASVPRTSALATATSMAVRPTVIIDSSSALVSGSANRFATK